MFRTIYRVVIVSTAAFGLAGAQPASAQQNLSAGCAAIQGGAFNNAPPTNDAQVEQATLAFDAGDSITVFIQDATNAVATVGAQTIFNGATGTQSNGIVVAQSGNAQVTSIIQGVPGPTSVPFIVWTCQAGTPPPVDPGDDNGNQGDGNDDQADGDGNTGSEPPVAPDTAARVALITAAETAAEIANETVRIPTQAAGLPSVLINQLTPEQIGLARKIEDARVKLGALEERLSALAPIITEVANELVERSEEQHEKSPLRIFSLIRDSAQNVLVASPDPGRLIAALGEVRITDRDASDGKVDAGFAVNQITVPLIKVGKAIDSDKFLSKIISDNGEDLAEIKIRDFRLPNNQIGETIIKARLLRKILADLRTELVDLEELGDTTGELGDGEAILFSSAGENSVTLGVDTDDLLNRRTVFALGHGDASIDASDTKFWVRARVTGLDGDTDGVDGEAGEVMVGVVNRVADKLEIGAFGAFFASDLTTNMLNMKVETTSGKFGLYANARLDDRLIGGLSASYEIGDVDTERGGVTSDYGFDALELSASLSTAVPVEKWTLRPSLAASVSHRSDDAHRDSSGLFIPADDDTDVFITGSLSLSRMFIVDEGGLRTVSPTLVATGNAFLTDRDQIDPNHFSGTVGAGAVFGFDGGATLSATAFIGGLGQDTLGYGGQLRFQMPF